MMRSIKELKGFFEGLPIAVLGGGPSLPVDLDKAGDLLLIAVNGHAFEYVNPDYWVFCDNPANSQPLRDTLDKYPDTPRVSIIEGYSSFDLTGVEYWDGGFSSTLATWLACYMGGNPVLLCGMDCYRGPMVYAGDTEPGQHICQTHSLENHLRAWKPALTKCTNSDRIKAVSGPLVSLFGGYDV